MTPLQRAFMTTAALFTFGSAGAAPPVAPIEDVSTVLHGTVVRDPYRWMEDVKSPRVRDWMIAQGDATRATLDRIGVRDALEKRIAELSAASGDALSSLTRLPGERYFYLKRAVGERQYKLVMRQGLDGAEKVVVDPEREARRTGVPHAINYFMPSWDGRYVAYGISAGGSENASLVVVDVASGQAVGESVPRVTSDLHWLPDSRSLTVTQLKALGPDDPDTDFYKDSRVLWLHVGAAAAKAVPVFGPQVTPDLGLDRLDVAEIITVPGSGWMVARTTDTTVPEGKLFVAPLAQIGRPDLRWQRVSEESDLIVGVDLRGDDLFLLSRNHASRRKLLKLDLNQPFLGKAQLVALPPEGGVLEGFTLTRSGVVTEVRRGTRIGLRRHAAGDTVGRDIPLPAVGAAYTTRAPAHDSDSILYTLSTWTELPRRYRLDGDVSVEVKLAAAPTLPPLPPLQISEVLVDSHDGVKVPMTILHRQGLALDGQNPVLLEGYAAYGFSDTAYFSAGEMAWIERGGVLAHVNARGSGVYGDDWHRAGFKQTKPNTWKDGVAAAKYLIAKGYGSPATMAVMGTSAGGIFVGRVSTTAPELFAAAVYDVGSLDMVRAEESANGVTNISEFGTVKDESEFRALLDMSTYHAIRDGVAYPAVLLVHGLNDPRVDVWNSAKTAARLQAATSSGKPVMLRLDPQAGHGVGSTATQRYAYQADIYAFLLWQMGKAGLKSP
jgi:prolyl oligopeptidase